MEPESEIEKEYREGNDLHLVIMLYCYVAIQDT